MKEQITVDKAIKRGHLMVNVPVFIAIFGCIILGFYLSNQNLIPSWGIGMAIVIGFVLAWLIWSIMITKWRIWAFENVRNVHELKKRAIQEKLIWPDSSIFEKTEIRNTDEKRKLENLNQKFELEDEFFEDYTLPYETEIHYSKAINYVELGVSILIVGVGIYFFTKGENKHYVFGVIMSGIGLYGTITESRKAFNTKPQIIINSKGIQTRNVEFKNWLNVVGEEVVQEGFGDSTKFYLIYFYDDDGFEKIEIDSLNVSRRELENIIRTYRIRHKKIHS